VLLFVFVREIRHDALSTYSTQRPMTGQINDEVERI
jgi:hypothetical protein